MKKIKKRKRYRLKRPAVVVSGVICAVCAVAFAGKAVSGVAEQKKQAQAAYYEAYYEEEADDRPLVCIDAGHGAVIWNVVLGIIRIGVLFLSRLHLI